ncbi:hypothetical protein D5018_09980 [Parashewanella curva]|uniref:Tetratricopeptide repeat protein n=1 Tax=Parashewanella curva TaxID=2338552 RepID=A0A3L8PYI7_9GAMM|nr:hypothetical protein [Parashewanella curva]RLV59889.1 hypothetical protein D5018_09980 [Parashewanella curva]
MFNVKKTLLATTISAVLCFPSYAAVSVNDIATVVKDVSGVENKGIHDLYNKSILEDKDISQSITKLNQFSKNKKNKLTERANAQFTIGHLYWRHGDPVKAQKAVDVGLKLAKTSDGFLLKARLLDAQGKPEKAINWYQKAIDLTKSNVEKEFILIRLTMINATENADALVELANTRDQAFKNRAAVVLAIMGYQKKALELYKVEEQANKPFQQYIRLADWAIKSKDYKIAQKNAWQAFEHAAAKYDLRYALSILIESYRDANELEALLPLLETYPNDLDLQQARVDVLVELSRYDEAIDLFKNTSSDELELAQRQRLIKLYLAADRPQDMINEYNNQIKKESDVVAWYDGLASHYMNIGETDKALNVWQQMASNNEKNIYSLVDGAESMVKMGFADEAISFVTKHANNKGFAVPANFFLFETYLNRGQEQEATHALERLETLLPDTAGEHKDIADAYERLSRADKALAIYQRLDQQGQGLGYDERMRLAWLYSINDQKQQALDLWQDIWTGVKSPARRSFSEAQLMLLAAELNKLADIVVDIEEKLILNKANENEINLLVRIYVEVGDQLSAIEVIEEFARRSNMNEVDKLKQLSKVYLMLEDPKSYDKALRQLLVAEPDFKTEHIRNIILNMLTNELEQDKDKRLAEVNKLLSNLKVDNAAQVAGEFEAGIMTMGGFPERAIESYRRSIAETPTMSDNLLLMSDLMKDHGRRDEAVSILQYVAEHADGDNEFVVAIDGIINMIGARRFGEELTPEIQGTFRWVHRLVLERITSRADKFYLYTLLAEISQETNDREGEFIAVENSLAQAGIRRSSILRELITLSTATNSVTDIRLGDEERKVTYGRRLIGLKQELPPEIYIDLSKTLLSKGNVLEAEKSFDMITDITGLIEVDKTKAQMFLDAGYVNKALISFNKALSRNRSDLELLKSTALLREEIGQDDIANTWYWNALNGLIQQQPAVLRNGVPQQKRTNFWEPKIDTTVSRSFRNHFESLAEGFIVTWPTDATKAKNRLQELLSLFNSELANVQQLQVQEEQLPLNQYSRLNQTSKLVRRVATSTDNSEIALQIDTKLLSLFKNDELLQTDIALHYHRAGYFKELAELEASIGKKHQVFVSEPDNSSVLSNALNYAEYQNDVETQFQLLSVSRDSDKTSSLFNRLIQKQELVEVFARGLSLLSPEQFKSVVGSKLTNDGSMDQAYFNIAITNLDLYRKVEKTLGRKLLSTDKMAEYIDKYDPKKDPRTSYIASKNINSIIADSLSISEQIDYARKQVAKSTAGYEVLSHFDLIKKGLKQHLSDEDMQKFELLIKELLDRIDFKNTYDVPQLAVGFIVPNAHKTHKKLLSNTINYIGRKAKFGTSYTDMAELIFNGSDEELLFKIFEFKAKNPTIGYQLNTLVADNFSSIVDKYLFDIDGDKKISLDEAKAFYNAKYPSRFYELSSQEYTQQLSLLKKLIKNYPEEKSFKLAELDVALKLGDKILVDQSLLNYYKFDPREPFIRAALYEKLISEHKYTKALALLQDGGEDLRLPEVKGKLSQQALLDRNTSISSAHLYKVLAKVDGSGVPSGQTQTNNLRYIDQLVASVKAKDSLKVQANLRALWRHVLSGSTKTGNFGRGISYNDALQWDTDISKESVTNTSQIVNPTIANDFISQLDTPSENKQNLFDIIAQYKFASVEFDKFIRAFPFKKQREVGKFYSLIADSIIQNNGFDKKLIQLERKLLKGIISSHDLNLYLTLVDKQPKEVSDKVIDALKGISNNLFASSHWQTSKLANLFAKHGELSIASEHYLLLVAQLVQYNEFSTTPNYDASNSAPAVTVLEIVKSIKSNYQPSQAQSLFRQIASIVKRADKNAAVDSYYNAFVLKGSLLVASEKPIEFASSISENSVSEDPKLKFQSPQRIALIEAYKQAGDFDKAYKLLSQYFVINSIFEQDLDESESFRVISNVQYTAKVLGISAALTVKQFRHKFLTPWQQIFFNSDNLLNDENSDWLLFVNHKLFSAMKDKRYKTDKVVELLFLVNAQLAKSNYEQAINNLAKVISYMGRQSERFTSNNWEQVIAISNKFDIGLPTSITQLLSKSGVLSSEDEAKVILSLSKSKHDKKSYLQAKSFAKDSDKLNVMEAMLSFAENMNMQEPELLDRVKVERKARAQFKINKF